MVKYQLNTFGYLLVTSINQKSTNWGFTELQVFRFVKTCVKIHFCFVSDVLQAFFWVTLIFHKKHFFEEVTSKYAIILHIFGNFLDMLREQVSGGSMWNIRVLTADAKKICQFLRILLFLQVTSIFATLS